MERIKLNFYKVGDIFLTVNSDNPGDRFTGTWTLIAKGRTLVGVDPNDSDFNTVEKTGGSKYIQDHKHKWASENGRAYTGSYGWITINTGTQRNFPGADDTASNTGGVYTDGGILTGNSGNLQPYFTCYIWCRTA